MRSYYYGPGEQPPEVSPVRAAQRPRISRPRRAAALFLCLLFVIGLVTAVLRMLPEHGNGMSGWMPEQFLLETSAPAQTTIQRAPLGDGTTLPLSPEPQEEPWKLQDIYQANIRSIVSVRGYQQDGILLGTGVIMEENGYIITNNHVIEGCERVETLLWDDTIYPALLVGRDSQTDLAVLKIDAQELPAAEFGDSALMRVGDPVAAIGNPLGEELRGTMTDGIISAINRDVQVDGRTMVLIQTNAALNHGNSGGALINQYGQVIGITNLKMGSYEDTVEGLGFAIPSATAKTVVDLLIQDGVVTGRPTIGITVRTLSAAAAEAAHSPLGIRVEEVDENSDAWAQGLRAGDVIVAVNGVELTTTDQLMEQKSGLSAGDVLEMRIWRAGEYRAVRVQLVEQYMLDQ